MDASGDVTEATQPVIMQSTQVPSTTGRPAYIIHAPGTDIPDQAPECPPTCWCRGRA
jgi:hypothetical protein